MRDLQRRREIKVLACWVLSWAAGLGVFWLAVQPTYHMTDADNVGYLLVFAILLGIGAAMAAWAAVAHWWPE